MLPEEDRGPAWLSDYGAIEADIQAMEDFAKGLASEVSKGYDPHFQKVEAAMKIQLPLGDPRFKELVSFMEQHHRVQTQTFDNAYYFAPGTTQAALAAGEIGKAYQGSDAFTHANLQDVDKAFEQVAYAPSELSDVPGSSAGTPATDGGGQL
ncbi:hypothetical protein [Actinoplanes sp. NPDC051494]|uniref:hypothetical protein n=1 Tax=Actinoplanes sp. NPDC051494 TaxID=3363907 RepID=UPI0037A959F2